MASPLLRHPSGGPYTTTLTFRDSVFVSRAFQEEAIQLRRVAIGGKAYTFTLDASHELLLPIIVSDLQEVDSGGFSGYDSLRNFLNNLVMRATTPFDFTDADGDLVTVRYWDGFQTLTEARRQGFWTGQIILRKDL